MTVPSYTVYSNHPRLFFRDTDKATLQTRIANASGWKDTWDNVIIPAANTYKAKTPAQNVGLYLADLRLSVLAIAGYMTETGRPAGGYKDAAILGAVYLAGLADDVQPTNKRNRGMALATVFDICFDEMTTTEKNTVAAEMIQQADRMTYKTQEYMDGLSGNDQMVQAALALAGYGYGSFGWSTRLLEAMNYFYGPDSYGGRLETERYFDADGGELKGGWYLYMGFWATLFFMQCATNATDLDLWTSESSWASKTWEWLIWVGNVGGASVDKEAQGDNAVLTNPIFQLQQRWAWALLAGHYPTPDSTEGGEHVRWLYDQWDALDTPYAENLILDVLFMDTATVTATAPVSAATAPATSRLFDPPGVYYYRGAASGEDPWDYDESVVVRISGRKWYDVGHRHLDSGSMMLRFKGDRLLLAPGGVYDAYGSFHHLNAYQRSWLQSLVPLVVDPSQNYRWWTTDVANDGGQHFQKYAGRSDPYHVYYMQNDAGGLGWLRCAQFSKVSETLVGGNSDHVFLAIDMKDAYTQVYTDTNRVSVCKAKFLIIPPTADNGLDYPAVLWYLRVRKADQAARVIVPFHSAKPWSSTSYGFTSTGYQDVGKLWVDVKNVANFTRTASTPGTPLDANGYGPDQFKIPGGDGTNYKPSAAPNSREVPDIKTDSIYLELTAHTQEEHYVALLMPTAYADSEPAASRAWASEVTYPDWHGITIGSTLYLIHKTQDLVVIGAGGPDTTPPDEVTSLAAVARDRSLMATWTDPADADLEKIILKWRTAEVT